MDPKGDGTDSDQDGCNFEACPQGDSMKQLPSSGKSGAVEIVNGAIQQPNNLSDRYVGALMQLHHTDTNAGR